MRSAAGVWVLLEGVWARVLEGGRGERTETSVRMDG